MTGISSELKIFLKPKSVNGLINFSDVVIFLNFNTNIGLIQRKVKSIEFFSAKVKVVIWAYKNTYELVKLLGKEKEVAELPALIEKMTRATHKNLYDKSLCVFVSGKDKQVSYASQVWVILSGVASTKEGATVLKTIKTML